MDDTNLQLASIKARALAFIIDDFLITFLVLIIFWNPIMVSNDDVYVLLSIMNDFIWPILFIKFIYQTFFVWYYGATIGKLILKIRVIDYHDLKRVSLLNSMIRSLGRILGEMFFYIGFIVAFFDKGRQTFHDKIGKTLVVYV